MNMFALGNQTRISCSCCDHLFFPLSFEFKVHLNLQYRSLTVVQRCLKVLIRAYFTCLKLVQHFQFVFLKRLCQLLQKTDSFDFTFLEYLVVDFTDIPVNKSKVDFHVHSRPDFYCFSSSFFFTYLSINYKDFLLFNVLSWIKVYLPLWEIYFRCEKLMNNFVSNLGCKNFIFLS